MQVGKNLQLGLLGSVLERASWGSWLRPHYQFCPCPTGRATPSGCMGHLVFERRTYDLIGLRRQKLSLQLWGCIPQLRLDVRSST